MRVYNGDVIYKVNIVLQSVPVIGHLMSKDKYIRSYNLTIDLIVSNPLLFIQEYRLHKDPANMAIERFKSSLQDYASQAEHDKLRLQQKQGWVHAHGAQPKDLRRAPQLPCMQCCGAAEPAVVSAVDGISARVVLPQPSGRVRFCAD